MIPNELNVSAQGTAQGTISLLLGHPDPATLLTPQMQDAVQSALSRPQAYTALQYSPEQGTPSLITYLVDKINREQRLSLRYENLMLVAGSTHAGSTCALPAGKSSTGPTHPNCGRWSTRPRCGARSAARRSCARRSRR